MNMIGVYHSEYPEKSRGICDAPHIVKGKMVLCAEEIASAGTLLGCAMGRIRNRRELTKQLSLKNNTTGAEIVLAAYRKWDEDYPRHLEGAVFTAVLDAEADALVLSRDRIGDRPAFYAQKGDIIAFSDHPDAILLSGVAEPVVDLAGARELFGLGPARTPGKTPYRDIFSLEPGCVLVARAGKMRITRYFALEARPHEEDAAQTAENVRAMLERAIDEITPLHPSAMLSGGLDSTVLTALLKRRIGRLRSFSVQYEGDAEDFQANRFRPTLDTPYVRMAVRALNTKHVFVTLSQDALADALPTAAEARGFPGMADVDSSLMLFSHEIAAFSRDTVSGECGDEVFGGYPWFRDATMLSQDAFPWSGSMDLRESVLRPEIREKLQLKQFVRDTLNRAVEEAPTLASDTAENACLRTMQSLCFRFFMPNLQERAVRMCEHAGINVLTPYSDERLMQYVFNIPWDMKFLDGREKGILRKAAEGLLPEELLLRKKSPYPKTCSPIYTELVRLRTRAMLSDAKAPIFQVLDKDAVERIAASALNPADAPWFGQLMAGPQMLAFLMQVNDWMKARKIRVEL